MISVKKNILVFAFLSMLHVHAQELKKVRDIGLWAQVGLEYELNKEWSLSFEEQVRFYNDLKMFQATMTDFGAAYKINKKFELGAQLRYAYARKKDMDITHDFRYSLDFKYRLKFSKKLRLDYRFRYQNKYTDLFNFIDEHKQKFHFRHRLELEYKFDAYKIFTSAEVFREYVYFKKPAYNNLRLALGSDFKTQFGKIGMSFCYERELNDPYPLHFFFLKLDYTLKLKNE